MSERVSTINHPRVPSLDATLVARMSAVGKRLAAYLAIEGVAWLLGFLVIACSIQFCVDFGTRGLRWSMRAALLSLLLVGVAWMLWRRIVRPLQVRIDHADVARLLERRYPGLSSLLISAVRFSHGEHGPPDRFSPALMASVVRQAEHAVRTLNFQPLLRSERVRRSIAAIVGSLAVCATAVWASPETAGLWFSRNILLSGVEWPKRTRLVVDLKDSELVGALGDDLTIEATAEGDEPDFIEFFFETVSGKRGRETMATIGSSGARRYRFTYKNAQEEFEFYLKGGDDRTRKYRARLVERPRIQRSEITVVPPAYTKLEATTLGDGQRSTQILPASRVVFSVQTNKPVETAVLMSGREQVESARHDARSNESTSPSSDRWSVTVFPRESRTFHFALLDEYGLEDRQPARFAIRVIKDEMPRVSLRLPGVGVLITTDAVLPLEVELADTYGLAKAELTAQLQREGAEDIVIPLPGFSAGITTLSTSVSWGVSTAAVVPGDRITLLAKAEDFDDVSGPNSTQSPAISLRVVTREELLAELARREQEYRMDFERLIDAQEQVRSRLLTEIGRPVATIKPEALASLLIPLERQQRSLGNSVNGIRQQFDQVMIELRINQLASHASEERIGDGIVVPLGELAKRDMAAAADLIRQWSRDASPESASQIDPSQAAILVRMRTILANMIQWEGYQEAVNMLRDILRLQAELREETLKNAQEQGRGLFEEK